MLAVNDEDIVINERTWRGMQSRGATMAPFSRYETSVKRFRRWLVAALAESDAQSRIG